nr:LytTR family DNA-binding domain-containing protein [Flavobacterium sp. xlx-221]
MPIPIQQSLCIRSYSDYQILKFNDIVYLKADNNSTDFKMINGKTITAYKTLKYYEETLPVNFVRIHKSYIVNIHYVSRIVFSKSKCFLNFNEQLPFSNSYRVIVENILVQNGIEL